MTFPEAGWWVELLIGVVGAYGLATPVKLRTASRRRREESGTGGKLPFREGNNPDPG